MEYQRCGWLNSLCDRLGGALTSGSSTTDRQGVDDGKKSAFLVHSKVVAFYQYRLAGSVVEAALCALCRSLMLSFRLQRMHSELVRALDLPRSEYLDSPSASGKHDLY